MKNKMKMCLRNTLALILLVSFLFAQIVVFAAYENVLEKNDIAINKEKTKQENQLEFDELIIDSSVYISNSYLEKVEFKNKNLKVITKGEAMLDLEQITTLFTYAIIEEIEVIDFSNAKFYEDKIEASCLIKAKKLKEITLPEGLVEIGKYTFYNFNSLEKINLPSTLKKVGYAAFGYCEKLTELNLNEGLEEIDEQAFLGCENITSFRLPDSLKKIGRFCFAGCKKLESVYFPENQELDINGILTTVKGTIYVVYDNSAAYRLMFKLDETGPIYNSINKVVLTQKVTKDNFTKQPTLVVVSDTINRGDHVDIYDLITANIKGTGAIDYSLTLLEKKAFCELDGGAHNIKYKARFYLADIDVSKIYDNDNIVKVDSFEEIKDSNEKFFVFAKTFEEDEEFNLTVTNFSSSISERVNAFTCNNSYLLNQLIHKPIMQGFKDGTFRPMSNITNAETAKILSTISKYNSNNEYRIDLADVPQKAWYANYVGYVAREEVMEINGNHFYPDKYISRLDFVVAACKILRISPSNNKSSFSDMWGNANEGYVAKLEEMNVIEGTKAGVFTPRKYITRAEATKILISLLDRVPDKGKICNKLKEMNKFTDVNENDWYYPYVLEATVEHGEHVMH